MANTDFHEVAYQAEEKDELLAGIDDFLHDSVVLPPGAWDSKLLKKLDKMDNPVRRRKQLLKEQQEQLERHEKDAHLRRIGSPFHGAIDDVKKRYRYYPSDFIDAFNLQCFFAVIFILFTALAPAVTFGNLLVELTQVNDTPQLGIPETLLATSFGGVVFGLFSAQPLIVVAVTGPLLMFEDAMAQFCGDNEIDFIVFRSWVGLWIAILALVVVGLEGEKRVEDRQFKDDGVNE